MIGAGAGQRFSKEADVLVLQFFIDTTLIASGDEGDVPMADTSITVAKQTDDTFIVTINRRLKRVLSIIHQMAVNSTTVSIPAMSQCTLPAISSDVNDQNVSFRIWGQNVTNTDVVLPSHGFFVDLTASNASFGY
jgi:hypothetical protein